MPAENIDTKRRGAATLVRDGADAIADGDARHPREILL
jgi:hypothetical protein